MYAQQTQWHRVKILEMTFSENDAESLAATRMAQKILKTKGLNYQDVMDSLNKRQNSPDLVIIKHLHRKVETQRRDSIIFQ